MNPHDFRFTKRDLGILVFAGEGRVASGGAIRGVARRCSYGAPQVLLCESEKLSRPFPTIFWLTCPHLTLLSGRIESRDGVSSMGKYLVGKKEEWRRYHLFHARLRLAATPGARKSFLRFYRRREFASLRGGGVGGIAKKNDISVKCVHLQIASYLGTGSHPAEEWLLENIRQWECGTGLCVPKR
ncbi:MAG: DUF501 domain-containing protein [Synergistaceae bacterium]|jgi:hypothetical protein|nr:DUF501 domain-containing protein [Synergistaceae bacterium]